MSTTTQVTLAPIQILQSCGRSAEELSTLVHQIYEAVARPRGWPDVVAAIGRSLNADKGLLFTPFTPPQAGGFVFPWLIEESHLQLWGSKYIEHDIWGVGIREKNLWQVGTVVVDEQLVSRDVFVKSVFYREFLSTIGIGRVCTGVVLGGAPGLPGTSLSLFRPFDAPAFSPADVAWCALLIPHLSRALGLQHLLDELHIQNQSLLSAFDRMEFGACVLDENGKVVYQNASASKVFERRDGLSLNDQSRLTGIQPAPRTSQATETLPDWIKTQIASTSLIANQPAHFSHAFVQRRTQPGMKYALQCSLLPSTFDGARRAAPRMVVFITDPDAVQLPTAERLMTLYELTLGQARVARALGSGCSYKQIARDLSVTPHTIASHVKEVYAKVRVNRQTDLMRHILALGKAAV